MGTIPYLFCIKPELKPEDDTTQRDKDKEVLLDFAEEKLYKDTPRDEIDKQIESFGKAVDEVTKKFRNKAAHPYQIKKENAKECFNIVLDVEKLLKKMIEAFNNTDEVKVTSG